jgi:putative NIF3 family GTP cyclohydrolase 1 type 2
VIGRRLSRIIVIERPVSIIDNLAALVPAPESEMNQISRREFVTFATIGAVAAPLAVSQRTVRAAGTLRALEIIERIKKNIGVEWKSETVDTFKAGDPATVVEGIVTTSMATMDVLRRAVKAGANLVITCEPTFYAKADSATAPARRGGSDNRGRGGSGAVAGGVNVAGQVPPASASVTDPIFAAKNDLIKRNNLVVWRFSDHWRLHKPDPLCQGLADVLGWSRFRAADDATRVSIPAITLDALASEIKRKLNARGGIRVVGDARMKVQTIGLLPGTTSIQAALKIVPGVDVVIAGEVREWESVEYVRDKITAGEKKGLILVGRVVSEEPGMNVCAQWLKTIVPELTTRWIPVGDPYWRPL